jgi:hypothetical protein
VGDHKTAGAEIVAELARRFQAGDAEGALRLFHPDIRIEQPASLPHGGWHHGHEGTATMAPSLHVLGTLHRQPADTRLRRVRRAGDDTDGDSQGIGPFDDR